jgi:hypothetical protein
VIFLPPVPAVKWLEGLSGYVISQTEFHLF